MNDFGTDDPNPNPNEDEDRGPWYHTAVQRVQAAAQALQWYGMLSVFLAVLMLGVAVAAPDTLVRDAYEWELEAKKGRPVGEGPMPPYEEYRKSRQLWYIVLHAMQLAGSGLIFLAGSKMKHLQSYGLAMTGSILAAIPCTNTCCCVGLPVGIWAAMILLNPDVKLAFSRNAPRPQEEI